MRINSIKFKVIGLVGLFVVLLLIVVGTTSYIIVSQSADAKVIDIAGRQRMLTQKMSKEAFALIFALKSRSAFEEQRKNLLETISLFDTSLKALKDGGVTLGTDGKELNLPESSTEANNQFNYLSGLWSTFKDSINLTALDSIDVSSSDIQIAVSEIEKVNSTLLLQSNKATVMLKEESEKKTSHLILVLISSLISTLLLTAVSLRFSDRSIIRPLENLTEGAELIGRGNLEHKVGTDAIDEVGQLSRTFDQMIENLNASRSELQKEIIVRKKAEEQISTSLKEKEVLLQEIHHRVKNNMTVITSLLYLQSKRTDDEKFKEMANDSISRISSMALIHEKLYRSKDLGKIDFSLYLRDLIQDIFSSNNKCTGKISLKTDLESMFLSIDKSIPCGLIVNELIMNSLRHAFPEGRDGKIKVLLHQNDEDEIEIVVNDNGVGMKDDLNFSETKSLGLSIIKILVRQLKGEITQDNIAGTEFRVKFSI